VPTAWRDAPAVTVGPDALNATSGVVEALHQAWSRRTGVAVILLDGFDPAAVRQAPSRPGEPWMLGARFEFLEDRLQFLLWANNYDARAGVPTWWWSRKAERLGARPLSSGPGDVTLPDGTAAWVDGGPRAPLRAADLEACALVHRETVERGQLRPAPEPTAPGGGLAQDQLAAVAHLSGPARIIAPPVQARPGCSPNGSVTWWSVAVGSAASSWPWRTTKRRRRSSTRAAPTSRRGPGRSTPSATPS